MLTNRVFFDQRWSGQHGIGRFSSELNSRLHVDDVQLSSRPLSVWDPISLGRYLRKRSASLYISPGFNVPVWAGCPSVITIHDLIHMRYRKEQTIGKWLYYRVLQSAVVRNSPLVFTVSEFSAKQIETFYGIGSNRIEVIGNGVSPEFTASGPRKKIGFDSRYFLYVGNSKPHKNVEFLLAQLSKVRDPQVRLVLVSEKNSSIENSIRQNGLSGRVQFVSSISDNQLAQYYRGALALILPSNFEGFGLPAVEAMSCGCPVIATNATSLPEIIGDAGCYFEPNDGAGLLELLNSVVSGQLSLKDQIELGKVRATQFSWNQVAERARASILREFGLQL